MKSHTYWTSNRISVSLASVVAFCFSALLIVGYFKSLPNSARHPHTLQSWKLAVRDQIADLDGLLNGIQSQQDNTYRPPPTKLPGEYLEWIYGPFAKDIGLPGVETDFVETRGGMLHVSEPYPEAWDKYSYSRNDTASYVVVLRTYAEHETSKGVIKITGGVAGPPSLLRSTEVSVVVTVVSRKSGAILARWDAPTPGEWEEGGGQVNFNKLLALKSSLATYELREAKWPLRQDAR